MVRASLSTTAAGLVALLLALGLVGCGAESGPPSGIAPASSAPADASLPTGKAAQPEALSEYRYAAPTASDPAPTAAAMPPALSPPPADAPGEGQGPGLGGDKFALIEEGPFLAVRDSPLSTFSIDVDTASYSKARQYLLEHHTLPPADAIRIEELINYFEYDYAGPTDEHPFAVHVETAECPWQPQHRLVRLGIQGKKLEQGRPVSNLVFLIDVSGSMNAPNRLPLVVRSMSALVRELGENDHVAIVVYAGAAGLVLPPTSGANQPAIQNALDNLRAGGSTNGGQGIQLAYKIALENFVKGGVNRVILCTDGDFNVGVTSPGEIVRLAEEKAKAGVYLSVLGFGIGNHNDALLEQIANKANGNYAFIDSDREAHKVLIEQMQGTLVTIAKDVKIQVEFNPAEVAAFRLIGYENRRLADRDFNDDAKDAGDIGAGHSVTALYQVVPVGVQSDLGQPGVDPLKYQEPGARGQEPGARGHESGPVGNALRGVPLTEAAKSGELLTLKLRYQPPAGGKSTLLTFPVKESGQRFGSASPDFQFAAAVAAFGQLLRNSKHKGDVTYAAVLETASAALGADKHGLRAEFLDLVRAAQRLSGDRVGAALPPAWHTPRRAIVGAPRVVPQPLPPAPVARTSGLLVGLSRERIFALGLAAGGLISFATLVVCVLLVRLRAAAPISFGPQPQAVKSESAPACVPRRPSAVPGVARWPAVSRKSTTT
jgi:Ca-activated chloride channel family protein